ncbi:MAG: hypothetical protein P8Y38_00955 [Deltaproteobacteria bacterium]
MPACPADIVEVDFKAKKIKTQDYALAALAVMAQHNRVLNMDMLHAALKLRFKQSIFETAVSVVEKFLQNFGKNF